MTKFEVDLTNALSQGIHIVQEKRYPWLEILEFGKDKKEYELYLFDSSDGILMRLSKEHGQRTFLIHHIIDPYKIGDIAKEILDAIKKEDMSK